MMKSSDSSNEPLSSIVFLLEIESFSNPAAHIFVYPDPQIGLSLEASRFRGLSIEKGIIKMDLLSDST